MTVEASRRAWRFAGPLVVTLLLLTLLLYQHTVLYLVTLWNQLDVGEYAHGYLVLAISAYLIANNRRALFSLVPNPEYRALSVVVAASLLWLLAALVDVEMIQSLALLLLLLSLVWVVLGNQVIRLMTFPILFIGFAIPVWFPISPVLQNLTADAVFAAIRLLSIPALRQENMIVLPAGTLSVEEACSGLRYLLAALTLGALYAYLYYSSFRSRFVVILISAGAAILANILRVFIVVYLAYATDMQHPLVNDHLSLGWYLFAALLVILLIFDARLHKSRPMTESNANTELNELAPATCTSSPLNYFMLVAATALLVSAAPAAVYLTSHQSSADSSAMLSELPRESAGWLATEPVDNSWMPVYHGAINQMQSYKKNDDVIILYVGYYPVQKQGAELINDRNQISNKEQWRKIYSASHLQTAGSQKVLEQLLDDGTKKQLLIWYWYNVSGTVTTNKYEAKILQILGLLQGKPWGFVTAVAVEKNDDIDINRQVLKDFLLTFKR